MAAAFVDSLAQNPVKVNQWNSQDIRVAFDDLICTYLKDVVGYVEDHTILNQKLAINTLLNVLGLATSGYAYFGPGFSKTRILVGLGAFTYLLVLGLWTLYMTFWMTPTFFRGELKGKSNAKLWLSSSMLAPGSTYVIEVHLPKIAGKSSFEFPIEKWIDVDGVIGGAAMARDLERFLTVAAPVHLE